MLAEFCRGDAPYLWIRANPWAGKSALLAWFALNPPDDVTVISFFITDRLADQNNHTAFTDAVLDQLAALLPEQRALIAAATINRDGLRNELLATAARELAAHGRRLVLVVDGLDEDIGKPPIVNLLPRLPVANLRVIVAGRHGPHLRIVAGHPLHDAPIHRLTRSKHAAGIRERAIEELDQLLRGPERFRRLLALVTAANGLTASELAELTDLAPYEIDDLVRGVSGRSFRASSRSLELDGSLDPIHALAHETLQRTAEQRLGTRLLRESRDRLHAWADEYREAGWPPETPDFLLRRYFSILDRADDYARMAELALDTTRHDRLRAHTGGDSVSLTEIRTVQRRICEHHDPDLTTTAHLARLRDQLRDRNDKVPAALPALWAHLGRVDRAEALALSLPDRARQADALVYLAEEIAETEPRRADRLIEQAESIAFDERTTTRDADHRAQLRARIAAAIARRDPDRALRLVTWIPVSSRTTATIEIAEIIAQSDADRAEALARTAERPDIVLPRVAAVVAISDPGRAEAIANTIVDPHRRVVALTRICLALGTIDPRRAVRLAERAEAIVDDVSDGTTRVYLLADIAAAVASVDAELATHSVARAEELVSALLDPQQQLRVIPYLSSAMLEIDPDWAARRVLHAETLVGTDNIGSNELMEMAAVVGRTDPEHAERLARSLPDPGLQSLALVRAVRAVAHTAPDRAESMAEGIADFEQQAAALISVAWTVADGRPEHAAQLAERAGNVAASAAHPSRDADAVCRAARALSPQDQDRAERLVRRISHPRLRADALISVVREASADPDQSIRLAERGDDLVADMPDPELRDAMLASVLPAIAVTDPDRAIYLALGFADRTARADSITRVAERIARQDPDHATVVAHLLGPTDRALALARIARAVAPTDPDRASRLIDDAEELASRNQHSGAANRILAAAADSIVDIDATRAAALAERAAYTPIVPADAAVHLVGSTSLNYMIVASAARTDTQYAEQLAHRLHDPLRQTTVGSLARVSPQEAGSLAYRIRDPFWQAHALTLVAVGLAESDAAQAESLAYAIHDPEHRVYAFTRVAEEIAARSPAQAKRLLARAWLTGRWAIPLSGLRVVDQLTLRALVSEIYGEE
ncbi:hypothetical protein [Nocardia ignorata]|uniref:Nephrocystin 3-like N-terminal domain-containing protein n=1 Tax=Nocardia ignorata TaxID=145285 RepID=A0A4R6PQZ8_NOCIG|nr:hypothetical protein [Nocardia ignorata]TDP41211.1 hypothetical protein DFR75_101309 [Nocardia ignorata]